MSIDPEISLVISFVGFAYVFISKIRPLMVKSLEDHINSVKEKVNEAKQRREEASLHFESALQKKNAVAEIVKNDIIASRKRIEKFQKENTNNLQILSSRLEASMKAKLDAERLKHKSALLERISDEITARIATMANSGECLTSSEYTQEDLRKLL